MPWIEVGAGALHFDRWGDVSLPPVLLLHELGGSALSWQCLQESFHDRCLYGLELRGAGLSEKIPGPFTVKDLAVDAAEFMQAARPNEEWDVFGVALGGFVAIAVAANEPKVVRSVCACEVVIDLGNKAKKYILQRAETVSREGMRSSLMPSLRNSFPEGTPMPGDAFRQQYFLHWRSHDPEAYAELSRALAACDPSQIDLAAISAPTLVLFGALDFLWRPQEAEAVARKLGDGHFALLPNAGHLPHIQNPAAFAAAVRAFWKDGTA
ncbi:MAG: alpha/beta hydrolase [Hyphomicrobiales bacterium]|nr:alpha/beta hydrolase [Hyphomicrobiales bacterium]